MNKPRVINLFAGPGTGKSTTAAALFAELKYRGVNTEYITEYAKDAAWEKRGKKVFHAQEYIFGKQHFKLSRVADQVDVCVTDSPLLLGLVYMPADFALPSLRQVILESFRCYDNLNVFLKRNKPYNPLGRNQTESEAQDLDIAIMSMLHEHQVPHHVMNFGRENPAQIVELMSHQGWISA